MTTKYEEELEERIASLETKYGYLKEELDELESEDFEHKLAAARKKLSELQDRGEDAWEVVKDKAEAAWKDAEGAFKKLKARF